MALYDNIMILLNWI